MKKLIAVLMVSILVCTLCACVEPIEVERTAMDCRYTAAYSEVVTNYKHEYSWYKGDFVLVPDIRTKMHPEKYEILYLIQYDDGSSRKIWEQVDRNAYVYFKGGDE